MSSLGYLGLVIALLLYKFLHGMLKVQRKFPWLACKMCVSSRKQLHFIKKTLLDGELV